MKFKRAGLGVALALVGLGLFGNGLYVGAKAITAQLLMERAWAKSATTGDINLPWSWMDAYPAAKLTLSDWDTHIVLNTDSGQALAFGPAIISGTDATDMVAIAAHKNTQFQNLKNLAVGDIITFERPQRPVLTYRVTHFEILDSRKEALPIAPLADTPSRLALVTCYPFDAVSFNGPLRYVVFAERVLAEHQLNDQPKVQRH